MNRVQHCQRTIVCQVPKSIVFLWVLALCLLHLALTPTPAQADATPIRVVLSYLDGVSNWGPKQASGLMELVRQEGEVRLTARGLPAMGTMHYVLWITREGSDDVYRLGEPLLQADGTAVLDLLLPTAVPDRAWNLALLTLEDSPNPEHPGPRRSLAGRFPQFSPEGPLPRSLPNTGQGGGASPVGMTAPSAGWTVAGLAVVVLGGLVDRAWRSRSNTADGFSAHAVRSHATMADQTRADDSTNSTITNWRI